MAFQLRNARFFICLLRQYSVNNFSFQVSRRSRRQVSSPGEVLLGILGGVFPPVLQILTQFQTKKCHFPRPFSDQTSKIHTRLENWPLGRNYVIITKIRAQTKKFFKAIQKSHIFLSSLFGTINMFIHSRSSLENHTWFQIKISKIYTHFQTKKVQKP